MKRKVKVAILLFFVGFITITLLLSWLLSKIKPTTSDLYLFEYNHTEEEIVQPEPFIDATRVIKACADGEFKSYMDYRAITNRKSRQWELQQDAVTKDGFRIYKGFHMIAVTQRYGEVGDIVIVTFEKSALFAIIGDTKGVGHDDCQSERDGSIVEFIVDTRTLDPEIVRRGTVFTYEGKVVDVVNYGQRREN